MSNVIHTIFAVIGRNADPGNVHDMKCKLRRLENVSCSNTLILDCLLEDIDISGVRQAARIVREMHRDAKRQGMRLRVTVAAAADSQERVVLCDGHACRRRAFVAWMRKLVGKRGKTKSASPPGNDGVSA